MESNAALLRPEKAKNSLLPNLRRRWLGERGSAAVYIPERQQEKKAHADLFLFIGRKSEVNIVSENYSSFLINVRMILGGLTRIHVA